MSDVGQAERPPVLYHSPEMVGDRDKAEEEILARRAIILLSEADRG